MKRQASVGVLYAAVIALYSTVYSVAWLLNYH